MSDGDTELRDLVSNTLENAGVLAKIRAELRASVFLVLEEHEAFKGRNLSFANKPLKDFLGTQEGIITVSLMREFLEYFGLEFSASVFEPETQAGRDYEYVGRSKLAHDLKLNAGKKTPLIAQVLQESKICFPTLIPAQKDVQNLFENGIRKEKAKEEMKEPLVSSALKADVHTNGVTKPREIPAAGLDNKETRPLVAISPPNFQNIGKNHDISKLDLSLSVFRMPGLGPLPPLGPPSNNTINKGGGNKYEKQVASEIKALLDLGSGSPEHNYEEDFHASGSEKASKGTNRSQSCSGSEVEEDMSVGIDDQTSENGSSNGSNKTSGES